MPILSKIIKFMDQRHKKRIKIIQNLYAYSFKSLENNNNLPFPNDKTTKEIIKNTEKIDQLINLYAKKFSTEKIAKTDLAILRWAIYELQRKKIPPKVIIDEAVELAKELAGEKSYAFINAILGKVFNYYYE